jgi:uncharacterized protein (TIGR02145 family)
MAFTLSCSVDDLEKFLGDQSSSSSGEKSSSSGGNNGSGGSSSGGGTAQSSIIRGTPVNYEGETYETVVIGNQTWMARNLNYNASGSKCYDNDKANCTKYGRLYDWATAMALPSSCNSSSCASQISTKHKGICPSGWHIPSGADWSALMKVADPSCSGGDCAGAGTKLKSASGWEPDNDDGTPFGTDDFGFAALPGGFGFPADVNFFSGVGGVGYWWSTKETSANYAGYRDMYYENEASIWTYNNKSNLYSVRCLQD